VADYHGESQAKKARDEFQKVFSKKELPRQMPIYKIKDANLSIIDILLESGLVDSKNEARRLIKQGGIYLDGEKLDQEEKIINKEGVLKVGKRRFLKLIK
jgi:tyrosyl-tRNA synthetase